MVKKGIAILLFLLVSAGFLYGFISYNRRLSNMMNQEIEQAMASEEPGEEPDAPATTPDSEEPGNIVEPEPVKEPEETVELILIPNIVGLTEEDAVKAVEDEGLVAEIHYEYIDDVEKGYVFYQRPLKNIDVSKGSVVIFSVSRGTYGSLGAIPKVKVPDLRGKSEAQAKVLLSNLKLKMKSVSVYSDIVSSGHIISQDIVPGREVDEDTNISVKVSLGKELAEVPNVINLKEADAKALIESKGLKISIRSEYSEKSAGTVVGQNPAAGKAAKGTTINVTVSIGAKPITPVPDPVDPEPDPVDPEPDLVDPEPDLEEPEPEPDPDSNEPGEPNPDPIEEPVETP